MMAYLTMMAVRLVETAPGAETHRRLYLHCDPTASHYIKLLLDASSAPRISATKSSGSAPAPQQRQNVWSGPRHHFFLQQIGQSLIWNPQFTEYDPKYI